MALMTMSFQDRIQSYAERLLLDLNGAPAVLGRVHISTAAAKNLITFRHLFENAD